MIGYVGDTRSSRLLQRIREPGPGLCLGMVVVRGRLDAWLQREAEDADRAERRSLSMRWFYDNGAWEDHVAGRPFDERAFLRDVETIAALPTPRQPAFVVLPDLVAGGRRSLDLSLDWYRRLGHPFELALAVQDGITPRDVPYLPWIEYLFVGGTTEWKLRTAASWVTWSRYSDLDVTVHVGRVGSARRVRAMRQAGVHSIDSAVPLFAERNWRVWTDELRSPQGALFAAEDHARAFPAF